MESQKFKVMDHLDNIELQGEPSPRLIRAVQRRGVDGIQEGVVAAVYSRGVWEVASRSTTGARMVYVVGID
jgi:hypothetical protein